MMQKISEFKSWFLEKINKIDKPLTRRIKNKRERTQINKIRNERERTTDTNETQRFARKYYEQLTGQPGHNNLYLMVAQSLKVNTNQRLDLSKSSFLSMCTVLGRHITLLGGAGLEHVRGIMV